MDARRLTLAPGLGLFTLLLMTCSPPRRVAYPQQMHRYLPTMSSGLKTADGSGAMTDMEGVTLERKITWGGLLTILTILTTAGINYGFTQSQSIQTKEEVASVRTEVRRNVDALSADINELKAARFDDNSRMVRVETLLTEILQEIRTRQ